MNNTDKEPLNIQIYRDGKFSRWETMQPFIHARIVSFGKYVDQVFIQQTLTPQR